MSNLNEIPVGDEQLAGTGLCPHCGANLAEEGIDYVEINADVYYELSVDQSGDLEYDMQEIHPDGGTQFTCHACGERLDITEERVIATLKGD